MSIEKFDHENFEETEDMDDFDEYDESGFDWTRALGIDKLSLNYPACAEGMEGECFEYSVYFGNEAGEAEADTVRKAVQEYDFQLTGDDYPGYISISAQEGKVNIYLDLGNTAPQNENKIIHGILLALNSVQGIKKVIVNEGYGDF